MSGSNCSFLTCIQVSQEAGKVIWHSHLFMNFPQFVVIHTVKGFSAVSEADVFVKFSSFFYESMDVGNLISGSSAFSKSSLYIWKFSVHLLLKPSMKDSLDMLSYTVRCPNVNQPCIPGNHPIPTTCSWCIIPFSYWIWFAKILLRIFASMLMRNIVCNSFPFYNIYA